MLLEMREKKAIEDAERKKLKEFDSDGEDDA